MHPRFLESNSIKGGAHAMRKIIVGTEVKNLRLTEGSVKFCLVFSHGGWVNSGSDDIYRRFRRPELEAPEFKGEVAAPCPAELASPCFCL